MDLLCVVHDQEPQHANSHPCTKRPTACFYMKRPCSFVENPGVEQKTGDENGQYCKSKVEAVSWPRLFGAAEDWLGEHQVQGHANQVEGYPGDSPHDELPNAQDTDGAKECGVAEGMTLVGVWLAAWLGVDFSDNSYEE